MSAPGDDPTAIRTLAVSAEDVVAAVEARRQRDAEVVLRATPPFSGRMRARLHVPSGDDAGESPRPVRVDPTALLDDEAPRYPRPADTEDELRADPDEDYTVERHHERHADAVAEWRDRLPEHVVDEATVTTREGDVTVDIVVLGHNPE